MARGFESKAVADQQQSAGSSAPPRDEEEPDPALLARRNGLELARRDIKRRMALAKAEPHREMLRRALAALEAEIASLE